MPRKAKSEAIKKFKKALLDVAKSEVKAIVEHAEILEEQMGDKFANIYFHPHVWCLSRITEMGPTGLGDEHVLRWNTSVFYKSKDRFEMDRIKRIS